MRQSISILILLLCELRSIGQTSVSNNVSIEAYKTIEDLELKTSVLPNEMFGAFQLQAGSYQWFYLILDSNMNYKIRSRDCLTGQLIESGTWNISFNRMLTLQSTNKKKMFDILQLRSKYYLVEPIDRAEFIQNIKANKPLQLVFYSRSGD